jgi:hypothetical protein
MIIDRFECVPASRDVPSTSSTIKFCGHMLSEEAKLEAQCRPPGRGGTFAGSSAKLRDEGAERDAPKVASSADGTEDGRRLQLIGVGAEAVCARLSTLSV